MTIVCRRLGGGSPPVLIPLIFCLLEVKTKKSTLLDPMIGITAYGDRNNWVNKNGDVWSWFICHAGADNFEYPGFLPGMVFTEFLHSIHPRPVVILPLMGALRDWQAASSPEGDQKG